MKRILVYLRKGGPGSGPAEGHPFLGNQWKGGSKSKFSEFGFKGNQWTSEAHQHLAPNYHEIKDAPLGEHPIGEHQSSYTDKEGNSHTYGLKNSSGMVLVEPNSGGKVWVTVPRHGYGGYTHSFPKGRLEDDETLTPQQSAHRETFEETGLTARTLAHVGDFKGDTTMSRMYLGVRTGGKPMGSKETEKPKLVTPEDAMKLLNRSRDRNILQAAISHPAYYALSHGLIQKSLRVVVLKKYSDDQERGSDGKWTKGGGNYSNSNPNLPSHYALQSYAKVPGPVGSSGGEWRKDIDGVQYFVKPLKSEQHGMNEVAANHVYQAAGLVPGKDIPRVGVTHDPSGQPFLVSQKIEGLTSHANGSFPAGTQEKARTFFGTDALLSNWDVAGLNNDNVMSSAQGNPVRIDTGGAMAFRGMGAPKPEFSAGKEFTDFKSMRESAQGKELYGSMSDAQAATSLEAASHIDLGKVEAAWKAEGIPKATYGDWLKTLGARQYSMGSAIKSTLGITG